MSNIEKPFVSVKWTRIAPAKGDLISFDAFGDGTLKHFRVLKREGNISTIISLDENYMTEFDYYAEYYEYKGSTLDNLLNTTYYNSLAENVKNAIIPVNRVQSYYEPWGRYTSGITFAVEDPVNYTIYYWRKKQFDIGERYVYALDIDDIKEYFNIESYAVISSENITKLLFGDSRAFWLSSAIHGSNFCDAGLLYNTGFMFGTAATNLNMARPMFKIDLTNINYSIE